MRSRVVGVAAAIGGLLVGGGVATAATKPPAAVTACVSSTGVLSLLQNGRCAKKTHLTKLSVTGMRGKTGAAGPIGPAGPTGPVGLTGSTGLTGATAPSDVYAWFSNGGGSGFSIYPAFNSPLMTVPAGSYVLSVAGLLANNGGSATVGNCNLNLDNAVLYLALPRRVRSRRQRRGPSGPATRSRCIFPAPPTRRCRPSNSA
jgi:hypothetical protein